MQVLSPASWDPCQLGSSMPALGRLCLEPPMPPVERPGESVPFPGVGVGAVLLWDSEYDAPIGLLTLGGWELEQVGDQATPLCRQNRGGEGAGTACPW